MIVIPMAGLSSRFAKAGYDRPKYRLPLQGQTVFDFSVASFRPAFETEPFLFVAMRQPGVETFVTERLTALGVRDFRIVLLDEVTRGQAETVMLGLGRAGVPEDTPITVFNIDTFCLAPYAPPQERFPEAAGVLQVFRGSGANWSFVDPDPQVPGRALRTAEKIEISDLCCTGLYNFASVRDYRRAYEAELATPQSSELYIAPMYNHLISEGALIAYDVIAAEEVVFCGVPAEYEALRQPGSVIEGHTP